MAIIVTKNSSTASSVPCSSDLVEGELAVNTADKRLFTENASAAVVELGTNPSTVTTTTVTTTNLVAGGLTYVTSDGDANQVLATNGSGALQWLTVSGVYDLATQAEAEAGTVTDGKIFSPLRVKQAIDALGDASVDWTRPGTIGSNTPSSGAFTTLSASSTFSLGGSSVTSTAAELNILDGVTSTTAELNILDGVTSTASELNILDGVTSTTAELNILDGVTATATELNILDGVTSTASELNLVDGSSAGTIVNSKALVYGSSGEVNATTLQIAGTSITSTAAELNILDGVTSTAAELNLLDGVTATTAEINYLDVTTLGTSAASTAVTAAANGVVPFDNGKIEESTAITSSSNAATLNLRDGDNFSHTLSENVTYTFSNPAASGKVSAFTLTVTQDSSARAITWPGAVKWSGGTAPTLSSGSGDVDVFVFFTNDGGTKYFGFTAGQDMS